MSRAAAATVCSMCGDVGFPEKLFRCARCRHRFQHSYCTNYYGDGAPASAGSDTCDWCLGDVAAGKARWSPSPSPSAAGKQHAAGSQESSSTTSSSGGSGRGGKQAGSGDHQHQQAEAAGRRATTTTTRVAGRRYKLLKDVLC
ncbi:uncharacterized protein LOC120642704 [Panicum virgatum]|uniref:PHD-type zinc finger plants domain-containing protein n=1 Tax=Panicum virgatum TaxID=38727 RepID=A0A8T0QLU7_PANVG|nr:uncharacterized protein LOC120642704 [Panicum virgatum]KAG2573802.1 hypothetical protein PVAP13_7KG279300 [Panicum virgatum]